MTAPEGNDFAVGNDGGAPKGNENATGNSGGGAPPANQNAARHHLHSDPAKVLDYLEREEPAAYEWVQGKYASYLEDAPFDAGSAKADQLQQVAVCEYAIWRARGIQVRDGLVTKTHMKGSDGELVEVERERPVNQPTNRMDRQVMSKLKKLGVLDDPDSQAAAAIAEGNEYYEIVDADFETVEDGAEAGGDADA